MQSIKWDILDIGCISRNKFWGEDDAHVYRNAHCTSTYINCNGIKIMVDPSLTPDRMNRLLDFRCGLKVADIDIVYITHAHGDHYVGIEAFEKALWYMAPNEFNLIKASEQTEDINLLKKLKPAERDLVPGVKVVDFPGHTSGLAGLKFKSAEGTIIIASDAVMTRDFFRARSGYYNSLDPEMAKRTIDLIAKEADIVVPGHDNFFVNSADGVIPKKPALLK